MQNNLTSLIASIHAREQLEQKLMNCRCTSFGTAVRMGIEAGELEQVVVMVREQIALDNEGEVEWCVGLTTIELMNIVFPLNANA
jgi:hypothetical protein